MRPRRGKNTGKILKDEIDQEEKLSDNVFMVLLKHELRLKWFDT